MRPLRGAALAVVPATFIALFFAYPVGTLLGRGLGGDSGRLVDVLTSSRFLKVIWFTTWQAAVSPLLAVLLALPLTWALANRQFRGRRLARVLVTVPFVLPTFIALMDRFGLDGDEGFFLRHTIWVVLLAHAYFNIAVIARSVGGFWSQLDRRQEEAARTLGASPWRSFVEITLPRLRASIIAAVSIVFLFSFTSFAIILLLGGPRAFDGADDRRRIAGGAERVAATTRCRPSRARGRPSTSGCRGPGSVAASWCAYVERSTAWPSAAGAG